MPSALCDGSARSVCNRETERKSGGSGLDKDNVCETEDSASQSKFQEYRSRLASMCRHFGRSKTQFNRISVLKFGFASAGQCLSKLLICASGLQCLGCVGLCLRLRKLWSLAILFQSQPLYLSFRRAAFCSRLFGCIASFGMQCVFVGLVAKDTPATGDVITPCRKSCVWMLVAMSSGTFRCRMSMSVVQRLCDRAMIVAVLKCRGAIGAAIVGSAGAARSAPSVLRKNRLFIPLT
jgi:hypothetical protein